MLGAADGGGGPHRLGQGPLQLGPGGVAAGVDDPRPRVPALPGPGQLPVQLALAENQVEADPAGAQVGDGLAALGGQHPDRHRVAQPGPGGQGVGHVLGHRVVDQVEHGRDPALGVAGGRVAEAVLGGQQHPQALRDGQGGRQPGHPGPDHQHVHLLGDRCALVGGGQQAARDQHPVAPRSSPTGRLAQALLQDDIVDQAGAADPGGGGQDLAWLGLLDRSKVAGSTRAT